MVAYSKQDAIQLQFTDKVKSGIFEPVASYITDPNKREDRMQEGLWAAWQCYRRGIVETSHVDDALLVHACRLRATALGRQVHTDGTHHLRDAMDPRNFHEGRVEILRLGDIHNDIDDDCDRTVNPYLRERGVSPEIWNVSAHDLYTWLADLDDRDVSMLEGRFEGDGLPEIARETGVSTSTACRRLHELGHQLADRAGIKVDTFGERRGRRPRKEAGR